MSLRPQPDISDIGVSGKRFSRCQNAVKPLYNLTDSFSLYDAGVSNPQPID